MDQRPYIEFLIVFLIGLFNIDITSSYDFLSDVIEKCEINMLPQTQIACENDNMYMHCPNNHFISIISASYGRDSQSECEISNTGQGYCESNPNATDIVIAKCNNRQKCTVTASNDVFGDLCPDVYKYLKVYYLCRRAAVVCEGKKAILKCPDNELIYVISGNYGRDNQDLCPGANLKATKKTDCYATNTVPVASKYCRGNQTCTIPATNAVFGDPCPKTYKYLHLEYTCV